MRRRDPRQARFLTWSSLRWVIRHRAWNWWYLVRYWRFFWFKVRNPHVITTGFVFLSKDVTLWARPGYGQLIVGRWVHLGKGNEIRCHEGCLTIGDKVVLGQNNTINCYLDIEIGPAVLMSDWIYICDFDHVTELLDLPIKDQGIVKSPVRIGADVWVGVKATVLRGTSIGRGCVVAAHAVVRRSVGEYKIVGGVPAKVLKDRRAAYDSDAERRAALEDIARKTAVAAQETAEGEAGQ